MADSRLNIIVSATDQTKSALQSISGNLSSIGKIAAGTALGLFGFQGVRAIFDGLVDSTLGMNQSMDSTRRSAISMLESIRTSGGGVAETFAGSSKQVEQWGRQLREIREREQEGNEQFAQSVAELNNRLNILLSGDNIRKRLRDEQEALDDLRLSHEDSLDDIQGQIDKANGDHVKREKKLQAQIEAEKQKGLLVDGVLYKQADEERIRAIQQQIDEENDANKERLTELQNRIDEENEQYNRQQAKRKRELDEGLSDLRASNDQQIAEVRRSLAEQEKEHLRFIRDTKDAYGDLATAQKIALSEGGTGQGSQAIITYREELQKLGKSSKAVFDEFNKFFRSEGVRSPFNIADIQRAGAQLIQFSGGSLKNMEAIVRMAESLASSPAVAGFSATERMDLAIRALTEAYNGQFVSMERIFNISGSGFEKLKNGTFTTTEFTKGLNDTLQQSGISYGLVDQYSQTLEGSWGNLIETGKLMLATMSSPVYDWLTKQLQGINYWVGQNQGAINRWADDMKTRVADFIEQNIQPKLDAFIHWLGSPQAKKDFDDLINKASAFANAIKVAVEFIAKVPSELEKWKKFGDTVNKLTPGGAVASFFKGMIGQNANGTDNWRGGMTWVGEKGPELVNLPRGSQVYSNSESRQMSGSSSPTINIGTVINNSQADLTSLARDIGFNIALRT